MVQTVLVVDDEWHIRKLTAIALEAGGYKVSQAESAIQALEMMAVQQFDLVLTDWMMPEMNGRELIERIREKPYGKETPVVVYSGVNPAQGLASAEKMGVKHWLRKPCRIRKMLELVSTVLGSNPDAIVHQ